MMDPQDFADRYGELFRSYQDVLPDVSQYAAGLGLTIPQLNEIYFSSQRARMIDNFWLAINLVKLRGSTGHRSHYLASLFDQLDDPITYVRLIIALNLQFTNTSPTQWKQALSSRSFAQKLKRDVVPLRGESLFYKTMLPGLPGAEPWLGKVDIEFDEIRNAVGYYGFNMRITSPSSFLVRTFYRNYLTQVDYIPSIFEEDTDRTFVFHYRGPNGEKLRSPEASLFEGHMKKWDDEGSSLELISAFRFATPEVALAAFEAETEPERRAHNLQWIFYAERHDVLDALLARDEGFEFLGLFNLSDEGHHYSFESNFTPFLRVLSKYYAPSLIVELFCNPDIEGRSYLLKLVFKGDVEAVKYLAELPTFNKESAGVKAALEQAARLRFMDIVELLS